MAGGTATGRGRSAWRAWLLASLAGIAMAVLAILLGRVDGGAGQPSGADRLVRAIDADAVPSGDDARNARRVLDVRPVDGRAYRVLAQVAAAAGEDAQAATLYDKAVARWPRDRMARAVLAERAFADDDIEGGLEHIDALLRVAPALRAAVLSALAPSLDDARFRRGLASRLARDPPWRGALPAVLTAETTPAPSAEALLALLATQVAPTESEVDTRIVLLDRLGQPGKARQVWLDALPAADRDAAGLVFDGGFERDGVSGGYGWRFNAPAGASLGHETGVAYEGDASLLVEFGGRAVQFAGVRQALALAPGRYRLSLVARNEVETGRPFLWRVDCSGTQTAPLVELPLPKSRQWQRSDVDFEVPAGCASQWLQLRHASRSMSERRINGALRIDDVRIIPRR